MTITSTVPWTQRRVLSYAHQGGAWEAPSSTLYAIRRALELGVTGIELDVHGTADGYLVVCHDATVDRTTNSTGAIADLTLAELKKLDNAYWFVPGADVTPGLDPAAYPWRGRAPDDPDFAVAELGSVLDVLAPYPTVAVNLDIKATAPSVRPYEKALAQMLMDHGRVDGVIVASFHDAATETFSRYAPQIATSAGTEATTRFWQAVQEGEDPPRMRHVALQVPASRAGMVVVDERFVAAAHRIGLAVHVWTVNDEPEMDRLIDLGVDGIISDVPSVLVPVLARRGVAWQG